MNVLVLGGAGFIGRHAVQALLQRGHRVVVGGRHPVRSRQKVDLQNDASCAVRRVRLEAMRDVSSWDDLLEGMDAVLNCVGILRERPGESYEVIHHHAPAILARACAARGGLRLIHVSALGLHDNARSGFITSKLAGERAIKASGANFSIVRPSLLDGPDGFGSRWMRGAARLPVIALPADALGQTAPLDVDDLGLAIAVLCESLDGAALREVDLGGPARRTMAEHLAALRAATGASPALVFRIPAGMGRVTSHICDLLHFSPLSYGHVELMRRDNLPSFNQLPRLLGRAPRPVGLDPAKPVLLPGSVGI